MASRLDLHPRTLRSNIWRGLMYASDQEIIDGMDFYPGAYGLCRLFSSIYSLPISHVAGIYAALSPMNTWDTNVANVLDTLRHERQSLLTDYPDPLSVNTTNINRDKALEIARGADPLAVLRGRKVRAFYNCIANPDDTSIAPAIDRHLINLALGTIPTKNEQSRLASNPSIYSKVEAAYLSLGRREGIGNRLASIAWFVQRRISRSGQIAFYHPSSPVCCNRPMWTQGAKKFQCGTCKRVRARQYRLLKNPLPEVLFDLPSVPWLPTISRDQLSADDRGRIRINLGIGHPNAYPSGWQWLARYVVESKLGYRLRRDEHVHHVNGILADCRLSNLEVWLAESHGRHHARTQLLYMFRDGKGRFAPSHVPAYDEQYRAASEHDNYDIDLDPSLSASLSLSDDPQLYDIPF